MDAPAPQLRGQTVEVLWVILQDVLFHRFNNTWLRHCITERMFARSVDALMLEHQGPTVGMTKTILWEREQ